MPTPLPSPAATNLEPPEADEVALLSRGVVSAAGTPSGLTATQRALVEAVFVAMTGHPARLDQGPISADELARGLAARNAQFRNRILQVMVLVALVARPLAPEVAANLRRFAAEMSVDDGMLSVAQRFAASDFGLAAFDFQRNGYTAGWDPHAATALHTSSGLEDAWELVVDDPALADRWRALEELPEESLGHHVTRFYRARGFAYPGLVGSAPPLLAQHDWVHVLADYGTTVEAELEVFAFIARANDDPRAFSLLAMVVSLFETGYLRTGAGLFEASVGHLSHHGVTTRLADAMRRGALCPGSTDFLATDWFALADLTLADARRHFGVTDKSPAALAAGSVGPWEAGGISPFQQAAGRSMAEAGGRPYDSFGATA
ncbi:MAG TPA: hypothetical protein VKG43_09215 [Acidimicrobiales bacterium]|nr:hypothetical protein [Acidimicrobiales bacterium]